MQLCARFLLLVCLWAAIPAHASDRCRDDVALWGQEPDRAKLLWILNSLDNVFQNQPPNTPEGRETLARFQKALRETAATDTPELLPLVQGLRDGLRAAHWNMHMLPALPEYMKLRKLAMRRGVNFTPESMPRLSVVSQWMTGYQGVGTTVALSPGGRYLFLNVFGRSQVWDVGTKKLVSELEQAPAVPTQAVFLPDNKKVGVVFRDLQGYGIWDIQTGHITEGRPNVRLVDKKTGSHRHSSAETILAISPGNRWLINAGMDRSVVYLWDRTAKKVLGTFNDDSDSGMGAEQIFFSKDGSRIVTVSGWPRVVRVWPIEDKLKPAVLQLQSSKTFSLERAAIHEEAGLLVTLAFDGESKGTLVQTWDLGTGEARESYKFPSEPIALSTDGRYVLRARNHPRPDVQLELRSPLGNKLLDRLDLEKGWFLHAYGLSSDGRFVYLSETHPLAGHRMTVLAIDEN